MASAGEITIQSVGAAYSNTPPPSASFEALLSDGTALKPDTQGAVGPNHLMVTLNSEVRIQDRSGMQISRVSLDGWWRTPGPTLAATNVSDPRVVYDPYGGRFIFSANNDDEGPNPGLLIAVSATSDPTGAWYKRFIDIDATGPVFADSPTLGFNRHWIVLSTDTFNKTDYTFRSADIFVYNKTNFYADGSLLPRRIPYAEDSRIVPVITYDPNFGTNYLVSMYGGAIPNYPDAGDTSGVLGLYALVGPVTAPIFTNVSYPVTTSLWADEAYTHMAPQLGTPNKIFLGDARITSATWRRGTIQAAHTVFLPHNNPTRGAVQWWEFTEDSTLNVGRVDSASGARMYAYPSIAANRNNDLIIGFTRFATNEYPSAAYVYREDLDNFNTERPQVIFKPGNAPYFRTNSSGENVWGDWSATMIDPLNDTDFWTIQPYAEFPQGGNDRWGTWWARVSPPSDLALTVTDSPDPVVAGSNLTYTITVTNLLGTIGGRNISGVRISNSLPAGLTYVTASASQGGTCAHSAGVVLCDLGTLTNLTRATASIVVKATIVGTVTNTIAVHANGPDADYGDNVVRIGTVTQPSADLQVLLVESQDPVTVGANLTYTVIVTNNGPAEATLVRLTNNLPASSTFVSVNMSGGTCGAIGSVVYCNLPNLLPSATATVMITARPNTDAITISNQAQVVASMVDTVATNNAAFILTYVNARPTITPIANQTIAEDTSTNLSFTIGDLETPAGNLQLATSSSTPSLIPQGNVILGGSGVSRNVTVTPAANQWGSSIISITVTDAHGASGNITFTVNVNPVNDVPIITQIANPPAITEDSSTAELAFTIGDVETDPNALTLIGNSSDVALVPVANIQFGGSGASRTVRVTPATNATGSATITVTVSDGVAASNQTFVVTINPINDRPAISTIADGTIAEDSTGVIAFTMIDVESGGALALTATSSNPALAPTNNISFGGSGTNRTVIIAPVANESGTAQITVTANDGSLTASAMFTLTVVSVNDVPTLAALSNITTNEDAGQFVVPLTGIGSGAANENQGLSVVVDNSNPAVIANPIMADYTSAQSSGTLVLRTVTNAVGSSIISVTVRDDGASNNAVVKTFTVTLTNINDAPVISAIANRTTDEDTPINAQVTISDVETPPAALTLTGGSSDTAKVPISNITFSGTGNNRTVTVVPATDQNGTVTITVNLSDGNLSVQTNFVLSINPINDNPRFVTPAPDLTIAEDTSATNFFMVGDPEGAAGALTVSAATSNTELIPLSNIQVGGAGSNRTVRLTPVANGFGSATITLSLSDGNETVMDSFLLTVSAVNDTPHILTTNGPQTIVEDTTRTFYFDVIDAETPPGQLIATGDSTNPTLVPVANIVFGGMGTANRTLQVTPAPDQFGTVEILFYVSDGDIRTSNLIPLTVTPVNDPPVLSSIPNIFTDEDSPIIDLPFTIRDPDTAPQNLMLVVSSSNPEVVDESGITVGGASTNRTLTVRPLTNQIGSTTITITVTDASNAVAMTEFEVTFNEVNDPPSISEVPSFSVNEDTNSVTIAFSIDDPETLPNGLTALASSSNQALVPNSHLNLGGTGATRTLTMVPVPNQFGATTISIFVSDGPAPAGRTNVETFVLTVNPVNDGPTISSLPDRTIAEDTSTPVLTLTVGDIDNATAALMLSATSSNPTVIPVGGVNFGGAGANRTVTVTPAPDQHGSAVITVTVSDGALTNSSSFTVAVMPANDAPTINPIAHVTIAEEAAQQTVNFSGVGPGAINENNPLVVTAVSSNPSLIPHPQVSYSSPQATGTLRFTPAPNASGTAIITVTVDDGGSANRWTRRAFTVSVIDSNDMPAIADIPNLTTGEDTPISAAVTIGDIESPAAALTLAGTSSNVGLLAHSNITFHGSGSVRTLVLTPTLNQFGASTVTVTLSDPGGASSVETFTLTVIPTNDAPTLDPIRDVFVNQGASERTITLTGISSGAANESQSLSLSNHISANIFESAPTISYSSPNPTATLTYRPGSGSPGLSVVTVSVRESTSVNPIISRDFTIYVKPSANSAPTISTITSRSTSEDTPITIPFTINDSQTPAAALNVSALSTNLTLLPPSSFVFGGSGNNRTLTVTPAANLSGSAAVTVSVTDANFGGASTNFVLTVNPINDPPVISSIASQSILANRDTAPSSTAALPFGLWDIDHPQASLVLSATSSNPTLVPLSNVIFGGSGTNRSVTATPALNQLGSATITVLATDPGGAAVSKTFNVNVIGSVVTPLSIARSGDVATIWWANNAGNLVLQSCASLGEAWADVPQTPFLSDGQNTITQTIIGGARLYRLRGQ